MGGGDGLEDDAFDVAIVGIACRFPGARDRRAFWRNLESGVESVQMGKPPEGADERFVAARGSLDEPERFDAAFFRMPGREALFMDPQHRLFIETAWAAFEDAGYEPSEAPTRVSVYGGCSISSYREHLLAKGFNQTDGLDAIVGNAVDYLASHVAYKLGLTGEAVTVQTACSTSLVAVHLACQSLLLGQSGMALAGGVCLPFPERPGYLYERGMPFSKDGHCRPYDEEATGAVFGSGVGAVLLRPLRDAVEAGDHIYAVIKGSAINNDGSAKAGFSAPSPEGQAAVIEAALEAAAVDASTISYIEGHGTATSLGDAVELLALRRVFANAGAPASCGLGSVKSNVGHLGEAAGVAGLIKLALCLDKRALVPTVHFKRPNPKLELERSPFYVVDRARKWSSSRGPLRAGLSAFGVGGTNAHVVLEEAPRVPPPFATASGRTHIVALSAETPSALAALKAGLAEQLAEEPLLSLDDVAHTLRVGRRVCAVRWAACVTNVDELRSALVSDDAPPVPAAPGTQASPGTDASAELFRRQWLDTGATAWPTRGRRIGLVTYPFEGERYTVEVPSSAQATVRKELVIPLSADTQEALVAKAKALSRAVVGLDPAALRGLCHAAQLLDSAGAQRAAAIGGSGEDLAETLAAIAEGRAGRDAVEGRAAVRPRVGFVFSGYGSQYRGMARALLEREPVFRQSLEEWDAALAKHIEWSLLDLLRGPDEDQRFDPLDTEGGLVAQPALVAVQVALARLWISWGVQPDAVVGHSMGEVSSAHMAGALSINDAARLILERSRALYEASTSTQLRMATLALPFGEAVEALAPWADEISIATVNGPSSVVFGGPASVVDEAAAALSSKGTAAKVLRIGGAGHVRQLEGIASSLVDTLAPMRPLAPTTSWYSTVTGGLWNQGAPPVGYWGQNLRNTVRFWPAVAEMLQDGCDVLIEMSPHPILASYLQETAVSLSRSPAIAGALRRGSSDEEASARALASVYVRGVAVDWRAVGGEGFAPRTDLLGASDAGGKSVSLKEYRIEQRRSWLPPPPDDDPAIADAGRYAVIGAPRIAAALSSAGVPVLEVSASDAPAVDARGVRIRGDAYVDHTLLVERLGISDRRLRGVVFALGDAFDANALGLLLRAFDRFNLRGGFTFWLISDAEKTGEVGDSAQMALSRFARLRGAETAAVDVRHIEMANADPERLVWEMLAPGPRRTSHWRQDARLEERVLDVERRHDSAPTTAGRTLVVGGGPSADLFARAIDNAARACDLANAEATGTDLVVACLEAPPAAMLSDLLVDESFLAPVQAEVAALEALLTMSRPRRALVVTSVAGLLADRGQGPAVAQRELVSRMLTRVRASTDISALHVVLERLEQERPAAQRAGSSDLKRHPAHPLLAEEALEAARRAIDAVLAGADGEMIIAREGLAERLDEAPSLALASEIDVVANGAPLETVVRRVVTERTGISVDRLGDDVDLFDLGIDSVRAVDVLGALSRTLDLTIDPGVLLENRTIPKLVEALRRLRAGEGERRCMVSLRQEENNRVAIALFPGAGTNASVHLGYADRSITGGFNLYSFTTPGHASGTGEPLRDMAALSQLLADELSRVTEPLVLLGHSFGCMTAYATLERLLRAGRPPVGVVLSHGLPPSRYRAAEHELLRSAGFLNTSPRELFEIFCDRLGMLVPRALYVEAALADVAAARSFVPDEKLRYDGPSLVVGAKLDPIVPLSDARAWLELLPNGRFLEADGAHFNFLDAPSNVEALRRFLLELL